MKLRPGELPLICGLVRSLTGVALDESKAYLIENRLGPIAEEAGCTTLNELYFKLKYEGDTDLTAKTVEAITTHETNWFRDGAPFEALQYKLAPESIDAREQKGQPRTLRIWSAACSTGQEPYGIAMVLREMIPDIDSWSIEILATDISDETLRKAAEGRYAPHDVRRSQRPEAMQRWFDTDGDVSVVKPQIRKMVRFERANLLENLNRFGTFDIVFLRNVLIYFDVATRRRVLGQIQRMLQPHGWLMLGATENLSEACPEWPAEVHCRATVYRPGMLPIIA